MTCSTLAASRPEFSADVTVGRVAQVRAAQARTQRFRSTVRAARYAVRADRGMAPSSSTSTASWLGVDDSGRRPQDSAASTARYGGGETSVPRPLPCQAST